MMTTSYGGGGNNNNDDINLHNSNHHNSNHHPNFYSSINRNSMDKEGLPLAHIVVCLSSILLSLQSVVSFFVFLGGSGLVRRHFKSAFMSWCRGAEKA